VPVKFFKGRLYSTSIAVRTIGRIPHVVVAWIASFLPNFSLIIRIAKCQLSLPCRNLSMNHFIAANHKMLIVVTETKREK
jgi:hypothetical protein